MARLLSCCVAPDLNQNEHEISADEVSIESLQRRASVGGLYVVAERWRRGDAALLLCCFRL